MQDSLDSVSFGKYGDLLGIWILLEEKTPQGLWAAVDDYWRQKLVYVGDVGHPVTPEELFDKVQFWLKFQRTNLMQSLQNQMSGTLKLLASQPKILIPKLDWAADLARIGADFGTASDSIKHLGITKDALSVALYGTESQIKTTTDTLQSFSRALRSFPKLPPDFADLDALQKRMEEHRVYREACKALGVDPSELDEHYAEMSEDQFLREAKVVLWMKQAAQQGRLQAERAKLEGYLKTGWITGYTLGRFMHLIMGTPSITSTELLVPPTNEFEVQIQLDPALPPQRLIYPIAPGQTPAVRVLVSGVSNQLWQPEQRQLWIPKHDSELTEQSPRHANTGRPGGRPGVEAHRKAIEGLQKDESRRSNYYQWMKDYEDETGKNPNETASGGAELYRKSVWNIYRKLTGKN